MFYCYTVLAILLLGFLGGSQGSGSECTDNPVFTPSSLVVKFNHSTKARCDISKTDCLRDTKGIENSVGTRKVINDTEIEWTVKNLVEWDVVPMCFCTMHNGKQCLTHLSVIVYQPPQSVSISFVGHMELTDSSEYTLQCTVLNVAPIEKLNVTFYRGTTALKSLLYDHFNISKKKPADKNFTLSYRPSKHDNGAQFWCEAKLELELGPEEPQPPPVVKSEKLTAVVKYKPELLDSASSDPIPVTKGKPLYLNCSAEGNPSPSYTWTLPFNSSSVHNDFIFTVKSVGFEHEGAYTCTVRNTEGTVEVKFNVDVKADPTMYIIAGVVAVVFLLCIGAILIYKFYYKPNRMGNYSLKDVLCFRTKHTAVPVTE